MTKRSIQKKKKKQTPLLGENGLERGNCAVAEAGVQRETGTDTQSKVKLRNHRGREKREELPDGFTVTCGPAVFPAVHSG